MLDLWKIFLKKSFVESWNCEKLFKSYFQNNPINNSLKCPNTVSPTHCILFFSLSLKTIIIEPSNDRPIVLSYRSWILTFLTFYPSFLTIKFTGTFYDSKFLPFGEFTYLSLDISAMILCKTFRFAFVKIFESSLVTIINCWTLTFDGKVSEIHLLFR